MSKVELERDKQVTREIHRLFWKSLLQKPKYFIPTVVLHPPFFFFINIFIPLQVAYGMQAIITRHFDRVPHYAWMVLMTMFITQLFFMVAIFCFNRIGTYGGAYVQRTIFANYLNKDYDFYSSHYIGALGAQAVRVRDAFEDYCRIFLFDLPKAAITVIAGLVVIAMNSPKLAIITTIFVLLTCWLNIFLAKFRLKYRRQLSQTSSQLAGVLGDSLSHGATVKSFAKEQQEQARLEGPLRKWITAQLKTWDSSMGQTFVRHILLAVTMSVLLIVSSHLYQDGAISIAVVALVQLYLIRVVSTTLDISEVIKKYESLMSAAYEPVATMMIPANIKDTDKPQSIIKDTSFDIEFNKISYSYPEGRKDTNAINDLSLKVDSGEKVGLVGFSGGGKTTLTKLLLRFMDVGGGSVRINGLDIRDLKQSELRALISYVPQEPLLFHRSIKENIAYSRPEATDNEFEKVVELAYIKEFAKELPTGYDAMVGERGIKLSGGQRQRIAIARALLKDSPILVLDEATSALDSESEKYIQKALWKLMQGRTAIVIAHRLSTIQKMDRIIVLDKGKIAQIGTHKELLKNPQGIYARLWAHQSGGYISEN